LYAFLNVFLFGIVVSTISIGQTKRKHRRLYTKLLFECALYTLNDVEKKHRPLLIVDTTIQTGKTLRKAYKQLPNKSYICALFKEPPSLRFWYEQKETRKIITNIKIDIRLFRVLIRHILLPFVFI